MKLTLNNILSVIELDKDGVPYEYHVIMKSHLVSDSRTYVNYDENGRTTVANYPFDRLPKTVQKFICNSVSNGRWCFETVEDEFVKVIYR